MRRRVKTLVVVLTAVSLLLGIGIPTAMAASRTGHSARRHWYGNPGRRHHFSRDYHGRRHPGSTLPPRPPGPTTTGSTSTTASTTSTSTTGAPTTGAPTTGAPTTSTTGVF